MNSGSNDNTTDTHNTDATVVVVDCDAIISLFVPNKTDRKQRDLIVLCFVLLFAFIILCMTWRQMKYQRNHPAPTVPSSEDEDGNSNSNSTADDKTTDNEADDIRKKIQSFTSNDWIRLYHTVFDSNEHQIILTSAHMVPDSNSNNTNRSDHTSNDMMEEKEDTHYFIGSIDIELGIRNSSSSSSGGGHTIYGTAQHEVEEEEEEDAHNIVNESNPPSAKNSYDTTIEEEQKRGKQNHYSSVVGIDIELGNNTTRTSTSSANLDEGIAVGVDTPSRNHIQEFVDNNDDDDDDDDDNSDNAKTVLSSSLSSPILSVWPLKEKRCVICLEKFQIGDTVVWSSDNQQHHEKLHRNDNDGSSTTTTTMDANIHSYRCHHVFHKVCMVNFLASNGQRRIRSDQPMLSSRTILPGNTDASINPCPTCRRNFCSVTPTACRVVLQTTTQQQQQQ